MLNGLRDRVYVAVDGQMKTGRDVVIAALLGAEEFGFATAPLVTQGCILMRKCHLNTCPAGVATQDPELRKKFIGKPEYVVNFMFYIAEEVRELMASLGFRTINEMIGHTEKIIPVRLNDHWKARGLDLTKPLFKTTPIYKTDSHRTREQDHGLQNQLDLEFIKLAQPALENGTPVNIKTRIRNINRTVGTMLSSEIAKRYGEPGLPVGTIKIELRGTAGQSFGTFLAHGIDLILTGESNDYTGKGLSGGKLVVKIPPEVTFDPAENIIIGNTCLYGATSGEAYINGVSGERFAVRNSGAYAVIEGVGDHGCEYMTGGRVAVLGRIGRNFAAGMSGGIAYVWDPNKDAEKYINHDMVSVEYLIYDEDINELHEMVQKHYEYTGSKRAKFILDNWSHEKDNFWKIIPEEYRKALAKMVEEQKIAARMKKESEETEVVNG